MTLDLAQFHETFFAESGEALDAMEAALLKLSEGEGDSDLINTIFRAAHSIKGGSATFGFSDVAAFTHILETLLDQLRAGKRRVDPALVDVLLRSGDMMRDMLGATQRQQPVDKQRLVGLQAELELIMATPADAPTMMMPALKMPRSRCVACQRCKRRRLACPIHSRPQTTAQRQRSAAPVARTEAHRPLRDPRRCQVAATAAGPRSRGMPPVVAHRDAGSGGRVRNPHSIRMGGWRVRPESRAPGRAGARRHRDDAGAEAATTGGAAARCPAERTRECAGRRSHCRTAATSQRAGRTRTRTRARTRARPRRPRRERRSRQSRSGFDPRQHRESRRAAQFRG